MLKKKVIVYGWYGKNIKNIGDMLFCKAFQHLFPDLSFTFTSKLQKTELETADAVMFGGGSFLYAPINNDCPDELVNILTTKKVFYVGIGVETDIHPLHQDVMKKACLIATRTPQPHDRLKFTQAEVLTIPDIVYSLTGSSKLAQPHEIFEKSVLVLPNAEVLPRWNDIQWKHSSWNYFKSEFSQFLDHLKESGHKVKFAPMCINGNMNDLGAASEIINQMKSRNYNDQINMDQIYICRDYFEKTMEVISKYEIIISQRYHGAILAHMCNKPCFVIAHHDKLKNSTDSSVTLPFYELSKNKLISSFNDVKSLKVLPIKLNRFEPLKTSVYSHLGLQCQNMLASKTEEYK